MNEDQRRALQVAETARDRGDGRVSFAGRLFMGRFDPSLIMPFPQQDDEDRAIGDELVESVSSFLAENLDADKVDATRRIPAKVLTGLKRLGVLRMKVPAEHGGLGLSQVNYNRVIMAIASHCGSTAVLVSAHQSIGVPQPLKMFGTDEQKERFFPRICAGELSAFALTEPEVGSDPARMKTTAKLARGGKHYVLNGEKLWTTNGPIAKLLVVMARTDSDHKSNGRGPQITALLVDTETPGVESVHRCDFMGLRGIHNGLLRFKNVKVPAENVLLGEGQGLRLALKTLNTGRLTLPAACTGIGKQCLAIAREWGGEREQWGHPVGRHEAGRDKLAYIAATTFGMEAVTWLTSAWADLGRDIRIEAAMAKLFCSEASWEIVDRTLQLRGGRGYERATSLRDRGERAYPVERIMRDCRINTIIEGTTEIMRLFLAREALDPHLKLAGDLLRPDAPPMGRARAGLRLAGFYGHWYPRQILGGRLPLRYAEMCALARHFRFIDRTSHRLAASLFVAMARHQQKLERRQMLLGHLMEVATELFAMTASCAYARSAGQNGQAERLADMFCRQARCRIDGHFREMRKAPVRHANAVAKAVLDGEYEWLEEGIIRDGDL
jgi:alkylation response protein AidB-like acyl-CoA dehydrogenase